VKDVLTDESAEILLQRGLQKVGEDSYEFTRDLRHRVPGLYGLTEEFLEEFAKSVKCPTLLVGSTCQSHLEYRQRADKFIQIYK